MALVYLAGPIRGLDYETAMGWREEVVWEFEDLPITCISPMRDKEDLIEEKCLVSAYSGLLTKGRHIYARDFNDVKRCDVVLVNFLYVPVGHQVNGGTAWEIGLAHAWQKPIVICVTEDNPYYHSLLVNSVGFVVETLEDGIVAVKSLLGV